jgi:hypothetical protein
MENMIIVCERGAQRERRKREVKREVKRDRGQE